MTAPASTSVTIDEVEQQQATPTPTKLEDVRLDGDGVPDDLKGKSAAELIAYANGLKESLQLSERARLQSDTNAQLAMRQPAAAPAPEAPKEMTDEELAEIHQNDPVRAIRLMNEQAERRVMQNMESRFGPMFAGTSQAAETAARAKYALEFEVLGKEINDIIASVPNARQVMTNPAAWDDAVAIVRGRTGNFERLLEARSKQSAGVVRAAAQSQQRDDAGISMQSVGSSPMLSSNGQLDPVTDEIRQKLGMTLEDYIKWSRV